MVVQMFTLLFYLSDLKIKSTVRQNTSISSLSVSDMIMDSQEVRLLLYSNVESSITLFVL